MTTLTTDRLVLRPLASGDADAIVRGLNNFAVSKWLARVPYPYGPDDAAWFADDTAKADHKTARFVIEHAGQVIGIISIEDGEMGYWLAEPFWGRGFGREAARAVTDHGFESMGFQTLTAGYFTGNEGSRRILEGLGFVETVRDVKFSRARNSDAPHVGLVLSKTHWQQSRERR